MPGQQSDKTDCSRFYNVNIHDRRVAAYVCRAFPLTFVVLVTASALYGAYTWGALLLVLSAFFNVALWLWVVSTALIGIHAALFKLNNLECCLPPEPDTATDTGTMASTDNVVHMIVMPNYKEDEAVLAEALRSLSEAHGSQAFWIILGMEAREGEEVKQKGERLQARFSHHFARLVVCHHPANLVQYHQDGSEDAEAPGKGSNMKYIVAQGYKECLDEGVHLDSVVLTMVDSDCLFHPLYFHQVGKEFLALRSVGEHQYSMWQAPQFPYRNFWTSPMVSRVWAYLASTYEFGGVAGTAWGGHHMSFSSFSLPLLLATGAEAWDGDNIAEDHHCWLKCFYFSVFQAGQRKSKGGSKMGKEHVEPSLVQIRPIFLPVKSTLVETKEWWRAWVERWIQAKRHAQGVAELPYAMLATYDALRLCVLPRRMLSWRLFTRMFQAMARLFCAHVLPVCQTICFAILSVKWFVQNRPGSFPKVPDFGDPLTVVCPSNLSFFGDPFINIWSQERYLLCGLAGAWVLVWPVLVPWCLVVLSNFLVMHKVFLGSAESNRYGSIWHAEDGKVPQNSPRCKILALILLDTIFGLSWILVPYGLLVELMAYVRVTFYGNRFTHTSASKPAAAPMSKAPSIDYGAVHQSADIVQDAVA